MGITKTEKHFDLVSVDVWLNDEITNSFRPPIFMIHGMFAGGWCFEGWAKFLCEKGCDVYVLKDFHRRFDLSKVKFCHYVDEARSLFGLWVSGIKDIKSRPIIIGHSMGGLIAQKLAEEYLVRGIVLVASAPPKGISALTFDVTKAMLKHFIALGLNLPLRLDRKTAFKLILNQAGKDEYKKYFFEKFVPESSRVAKQLAFSRIPVDHRKIICKSLVVAGFYDKLLPLETQIKIADKYVSDYLEFQCGHMPMIESCWKRVISSIYEWINLNFIY